MSSKYAETGLLAEMAKIGLSDDELKSLEKDLQNILSYVQLLEKTVTKNTPPTRHISGLVNQLREDEVQPSDNAEAIRQHSAGNFQIPTVRSLWNSIS